MSAESKVAAPVDGHTPGPWVASGCTVLVDSPPQFIATVGAPSSRGDADLANARLIAAAPELLEALMQAHSLFQQINRDDGDEFKNLSCDGLDLLEPLIARATGVAS